MNTEVMFSRKTDEWSTPQDLYDALDAEFKFDLDAAATADNAKRPWFFGPGSPYGEDALAADWGQAGNMANVWLNPPYSRTGEFLHKAVEEVTACRAKVVACLVPARTDTRWFHSYVWDRSHNEPWFGVEVRFLKGRLKFGGSTNSAPFPSMIVIIRG